jgi:superfamily I DNA/RNA helicase
MSTGFRHHGEGNDPSQRAVIESDPRSRLLVDAGPGTGKTHVACCRVAWLAETGGLPATSIWLISFTRTAVQEIRERISRVVEDPMIARAVHIGTVDSTAWQLNRGYNPAHQMVGSFEDNIRALHGELEANEGIREYLQTLRHLIIDEAQDIVGARAELLLALIEALPSDCGVTVFSDDAQAIYGFAEGDVSDQHHQNEPILPLPHHIRSAGSSLGFAKVSLSAVHRTSDRRLIRIFTDVRQIVLVPGKDARSRHAGIRSALSRYSHGEIANLDDTVRSLTPDTFILFRRRAEVLTLSSMYRDKGIQHRVRMSGFGGNLPPWIALALNEVTDRRIDRSSFDRCWGEQVEPTGLGVIGVDAAWEVLLDLAAAGRVVDLGRLRDRLSARPPAALLQPEIGREGPIIGTVHAAKGREARSVVFMMPDEPDDDEAPAAIDEETRVLFVAATRARRQLLIGSGHRGRASRLEGGRVYRFNKRPFCSVEVGRAGDLEASGLAGRQFFNDSIAVRDARARWIALATFGGEVSAVAEKIDDTWHMSLRDADDSRLGVLSPGFCDNLWEISKAGCTYFRLSGTPWSPSYVSRIWATGLTSVVLPSGNAGHGTLVQPWQTSGFVLAPVLFGFSPIRIRSSDEH